MQIMQIGRAWLCSLGLCLPCFADNMPSGEFITEHGWGRVTLQQTAQGGTSFHLNAVGANGHTCELGGALHNGRAELRDDPADAICEITVTPQKGGITVDSNHADSCRAYCGMRASFEGLYLKPAKGCDDVARVRARNSFKALYDKKNYKAAYAALAPVLQQCGQTMDWLESGWVRNDLALTQYKLGDVANCKNTLAPLADDAALTDDDIRQNYPPTDAESYLPIIKATRTNLKLCHS